MSCMPTYRLLLSPMLAATQAWLEKEHMLTFRLSMLADGCCCNLNASACFVLLARNSLQCSLTPQLDFQLSLLVTTITAAACAEEEAGRKHPCSMQRPHDQSHGLQIGPSITSSSAADLPNLACSPLLDCHSCGPPVCSRHPAAATLSGCCWMPTLLLCVCVVLLAAEGSNVLHSSSLCLSVVPVLRPRLHQLSDCT